MNDNYLKHLHASYVYIYTINPVHTSAYRYSCLSNSLTRITTISSFLYRCRLTRTRLVLLCPDLCSFPKQITGVFNR